MSENLFGEQEPVKTLQLKNRSGSFNINPCIAVFGAGPEGSKCKNCKQLRTNEKSKKFFKCALRTSTNGPATDHKFNWPGCSKFEQISNDGGLVTKVDDYDFIKAELYAGKVITVEGIRKSRGTKELRTYIPILRRDEGMDILTKWIYANGSKWKEYWLNPESLQKAG